MSSCMWVYFKCAIWSFPLEKKTYQYLLSQTLEVVQCWMNGFIEGLQCVEVFVDDYLVVRFGHTHVEAVQHNDKSLMALHQP